MALVVAGAAFGAQAQDQAGSYAMGANNMGLAFSVGETYDSNVARSSAAQAAARGLHPEDAKTDVNLNLDLLHALGRQSVFLAGDVGYQFFDKNTVLNRQKINLQGGIVMRAASCNLVLSDSVSSAQTSLDELVNTVTKNEQNVNQVSASGACARTLGLSPTFSLSESQGRNSSSRLKGQDYNNVSGSAGVAFDRPALGRISVFGSYAKTEYTRSSPLAVLTGQVPSFEVTGGGVSYNRALGARLRIALQVSYSTASQSLASRSNFKGFVYGGNFTYTPNSRIVISLNANRSVNPSIQLGATYQVVEKYEEQLRYRLSGRLALEAGASQSDTSFQGASAGPALILSDQSNYKYFAAATLTFLRVNSIKLNIQHDERQSNVAAFNYDSNQVSLTYTRHN
jgi:hypothetical protein